MTWNGDDDLEQRLERAQDLARRAGQILLRHFRHLEGVEEKGPGGDLVTVADREAEACIVRELRTAFPGDAIQAEETGAHGEAAERVWHVDPLDGTTNYAHGLAQFAVSLGLAVGGEPVLGVVYAPALQEMFTAARGLGAFLNGRPIAVSRIDELERGLLVTGFPYDRRQVADNNLPEFCRLTLASQGVRRLGSAALDLAFVAAGRFDGFWERGLSPWDIAAGVVLVREAGGRVTDYQQGPLDLRGGRLLATNGRIHEALARELAGLRNRDHLSVDRPRPVI